jgi:glycogen synthase
MEILVISGTFPPRNFGGVTAVSYNLAKRLVELGHGVTVYTTDVGNSLNSRLDVQDIEVIDGITVHYFKNISNSLAFKHRLSLPLGCSQL